MYNLFLDDLRLPQDAYSYKFDKDYLELDWQIVRNYEMFTAFIEEHGIPEVVSFDHDLADKHYRGEIDYNQLKEKTGYHCAQWLIEYCRKHDRNLPVIKVHTMNPVGDRNIKSLFKNA